MSSMYLESYLDSIESLPFDLQRNLSLLRQLDVSSHEVLRHIEDVSNDLLKQNTNLTRAKRKERLKEVIDNRKKCLSLADDKVQLAVQTYEMVDKHIRRLDSDSKKFEADMIAEQREQAGILGGSGSVGSGMLSEKLSGPPLDMPVDPNEPTYCICKQVSHGDMIACDNVECPIEWFHYACVGITQKPKGSWICQHCTELKKRGLIKLHSSAL